MAEVPLSRQPSCSRGCGHEEHRFFYCEQCLCPPHEPAGIYPKEA